MAASKRQKTVHIAESDVTDLSAEPESIGEDMSDFIDDSSSTDAAVYPVAKAADYPFYGMMYEGLVDETVVPTSFGSSSSSSSSDSVTTAKITKSSSPKSVLMVFIPQYQGDYSAFEVSVSNRQGMWFVEWTLQPPASFAGDLPASISRLMGQVFPRPISGSMIFPPSGGLPLDESALVSFERINQWWVAACCDLKHLVPEQNIVKLGKI